MPIPTPPTEAEFQNHPVVDRAAWLEARKALLAEEKALTRQADEVSRRRRALPWVRITNDYVFEAPEGKVRLAALFRGRSQLIVYHFMFGPDWKEGCDGCSFLCDHVDGARQHFEHHDAAFAAVSRAPLAQFQDFKRRMGWSFPWVSSHGTTFNHDFGVSFTPEQLAASEVGYNYGTTPYRHEELHGLSVFARKADGAVYHTYSAYARGVEMLTGALMFLDLTPRGRNERGTMDWVRLHDRYEGTEVSTCCKH